MLPDMRLGVKTGFILRAIIAKYALLLLRTSMGREFVTAREWHSPGQGRIAIILAAGLKQR